MEELLNELTKAMLLHEKLIAKQKNQITKLIMEIRDMKQKLSVIEKSVQNNKLKLR